MIIYDDHIWWSLGWSYMMIIWESSGSHLGVIWGSSGRHLGVIWDPFVSHLGSIWRHLGGWRLKRHLEARSHIMCLTLEQNAKVPSTFQSYAVFLRVPSIMTAYLLQDLLAGSATDPAQVARPLYQDRENPYSWRLFGEYMISWRQVIAMHLHAGTVMNKSKQVAL